MKKILENWTKFKKSDARPSLIIETAETGLEAQLAKDNAEIFGVELDHKLGHGAFGTVWQVTDLTTGQKMAMKVIKDSYDSKIEVQIYKVVARMRRKLGKYKKHFPVVFKTSDNAILMELLEPLPDDILLPNFSNIEKNNKKIDLKVNNILKSETLIRKLLESYQRDSQFLSYTNAEGSMGDFNAPKKTRSQKIYSNFFKVVMSLRHYGFVDRVLWHFFKKEAPKAFNNSENRLEKLQSQLESLAAARPSTLAKVLELVDSAILAIIDFIEDDLSTKLTKQEKKWVATSCEKELTKEFSDYLSNSLVPVNPEAPAGGEYGILKSPKEAEEVAPELVSFMKAIKALAKTGITPQDIHSGNVMKRPRTGDIVLVDLGNFY